MATTNPARSPKRIRRWLQTTAAGTVLVSSSLFGLIAVQGANATAHEAGAAISSATPWTWQPERGAAAAIQVTAPAAAAGTPIATRTVVPANAPAATASVAATSTAIATSTPAAQATPTVRARTRAS